MMLIDFLFALAQKNDVVTMGMFQPEHLRNLDEFINGMRQLGFKLRITKYSFFLLSIQFFGFKNGKEGCPYPPKVAAIN